MKILHRFRYYYLICLKIVVKASSIIYCYKNINNNPSIDLCFVDETFIDVKKQCIFQRYLLTFIHIVKDNPLINTLFFF